MMSMLENGTKIAASAVEGLKSQPLALAVIIINVLFLVFGAWGLYTVGEAVRTHRAAQDKLLSQMAVNCAVLQKVAP